MVQMKAICTVTVMTILMSAAVCGFAESDSPLTEAYEKRCSIWEANFLNRLQ